jgi:hypothetical protein
MTIYEVTAKDVVVAVVVVDGASRTSLVVVGNYVVREQINRSIDRIVSK